MVGRSPSNGLGRNDSFHNRLTLGTDRTSLTLHDGKIVGSAANAEVPMD